MSRLIPAALFGLACLLGPSPASRGATVLNDTFADGNSQNQDLATNSVWLFNGRPANTRTDAVGSTAFAITSTSSEGLWAFFTASGAPVTLGVGDRITASMTFSVSGLVGTGQDIRGGLLNSAATRNTANLTGGMNSAIFADDPAYAFQFYASGTGSPFVLYERNAPGATANPNNPYNSMAATDWVTLTTDATGAASRTALENGVAYTITFSVFRASDVNTQISIAVTGGSLAADFNWTATDVGGPVTAFDCVGFRIGGSGFATGLTFTNVKIELAPAAPVITAQPTFTGGLTALTVGTGGQTTISVTATGQNLAYQWKKDGADIAGATNTTLALTNLQVADSGAYTVVVSNEGGPVTSNAATLTVSAGPVDPAPVINTHPTNQTVTNGAAASFTVAATGNNLLYQWSRNGVDLAGANSATLNFATAQASDAGTYRVTVSNGGGNVTSNAATLTVLSPTLTFSSFAPANSATGVFPDAKLVVTFGSAPSFGTSGTIKIHDAANDSVVETIDLAVGTTNAGVSFLANTPYLTKTVGGTSFNYYPVVLAGNTATIHPRNGVLAYNKTYYVTIDPGFFVDATGINAGLPDTAAWRFSTRSAGPVGGTTFLVVAADGSGDFLTVQAAIDFVPANNTTPTTIRIKNGTYWELVNFASKHNLALVGESRDGVTLTYPNNNTLNGSGYRAVFYANNVHDVLLANLTIRNATPQNGSQAEAIILKGSATTGKNILHRLKLYSYQDTLQVNGQCYVEDTFIEGDVDFMWGNGPAFFRNCELRIVRTAGYYTQVRNPATNHGFVYANCRFTAATAITGTFLGRIDPAVFPSSEVVLVDSTVGDATNNALLATTVGTSGSNYLAGWWLLNNAADTSTAGNVRYWDNATIDKDGAPLTFASRPAFTVMPTDATTLANYRDAFWVLNTALDGTVNGAWTPAYAPLIAAQPVALTRNAGLAASFSVEALALPAATYQWRKDGVAIAGATSATYAISSVTAGDAGGYSVVVTNSGGSVTSDTATLTVTGVGAAPGIVTQPVSQGVTQGSAVALSVVAAGDPPLTYQWKKSTDGSTFTNIAGATAATLSIASAQTSDAATYRVEVSNPGGSVLSNSATITVNLVGAIRLDGYAASVTGGASGTTVTANSAASLETYAESTTPYTIIVSGVVDLGASGRINVTSDKTIQGLDTTATIIGTLTISNASNVIIRNLNITAPTGAEGSNDGITVAASTNVLVTKCSVYDCMDGCLDIINGSDLVTVSWCKFYFTRAGGHKFPNLIGSSDTDTGTGNGLTNYRITWHHNWWSTTAQQRMIACRFGSSHMFNNYWDCAGNDYCTESRNIGSIFSEHNYYDGVKDPLARRTALPTDVGLLMTIGNVFNACTGSQLVASDVVFAPPYAYTLRAAASVPALVKAGAGNVAVDAPVEFSASIAGPAAVVVVADPVALTVTPAGFTPVSYQWRRNHQAIAGATAATLSFSSVAAADGGDYTVVLELGSGDAVVSAPYRLTVNTTGVSIRGAAAPVTAGGSVTLTTNVQGVTPTSYQWQLDGVNIAGATSSTYTAPSVQEFHAGNYTVVVGVAGGGTISSAAAPLTVNAAPPSNARLINMSTRGLAQSGDNVLIPGFVVSGSANKRLLIRAVGPTLAQLPFNLADTLPDPRMTLKRLDTSVSPAVYVDVATNDDWSTNTNAADITTTAAQLFAFEFKDAKESALLLDLAPGQYTVIAGDKNGASGLGIVEFYDADADTSGSRLINISNRGFCGIGDQVMIPGFVVSTEGPKTFLIRVVGPTLAGAPFNVAGTMADPKLEVFPGSASTPILANDNWSDNPDAATTTAVAQQVSAFALASGSKDAAFVVTLQPGIYTVVGSSATAGGTGVVLVEVYVVP